MTFKFTVKQNPLEIEFEAGSIGEGLAILSSSTTELGQFFATAAALQQSGAESAPGAEITTVVTNGATDGGKAPRKRRSNAEIAADNARIAAANAPPPAPVPGAAPPAPPTGAAPSPPAPPPPAPAPVDHAGGENGGVPAFLNRTAPAAATAAAPPPPPPAAPPTPPAAAAPAITLAPKVIAECKRRATGSVDGGKALAEWLAKSGVVVQGASFDEALAVLQFHDDAKMAPIAAALSIS